VGAPQTPRVRPQEESKEKAKDLKCVRTLNTLHPHLRRFDLHFVLIFGLRIRHLIQSRPKPIFVVPCCTLLKVFGCSECCQFLRYRSGDELIHRYAITFCKILQLIV
jgi:hypothetical protein